MLTLLFLVLIFLNNHVAAVFDDEAFRVDWHRDNLGHVLSVDRFEDKILVLSETADNTSLISWLNVDTGNTSARLLLDLKASSFEVRDGKIFLDNGKIFDSKHGFELSSSPDMEFVSPFNLDLEQVNIQGSTLQFPTSSNGNIQEFDLPPNFRKIEYFKAESDTFDLLISTTDEHYIFCRAIAGTLEVVWDRDESLFDIVAYALLDEVDKDLVSLHDEVKQEENLSLFDAYSFRLKNTFNRLSEEFIRNKFNLRKMLAGYLSETDISAVVEGELLFGFRKQLLLATRAGLIVSLDIRTGSELWRMETRLSNILSIGFINEKTVRIVTANSTVLLHTNTPEFILEVEQTLTSHESIGIMSGSVDLITDNDLNSNISLLDDTPAKDTYIISHDAKRVQGYYIHDDRLIPTWEIENQETESILSLSTKDSASAASLGVVLGNRTVLYKYLNPNIAAYLVSNNDDQKLTMNIIETVTGELLYSTIHDELVDLHLPVNIVVGEYWVIYSYFSRKPVPEQKLVVVELYESLTPDTRITSPGGCHDSLGNKFKPEVVTRSYLFPQIIQHMTISKTKFGITTPAIILQLDDGSITYVLKYLLSARRVEESLMSDTDKKEFMALPYDPVIPINDHFVISHFRNILPSKHVHLFSVPTNLESTSIVCSIGNDLFCTKISPSSQFDKLATNFEKSKLGITILGLLLLCYFLRPMVIQRKLKTKWLVKDIDISAL